MKRLQIFSEIGCGNATFFPSYTLESDLPIVYNIEPKNIFKLKKLLSMLCEAKPYDLNITRLATKIKINRNTLYHRNRRQE